MSHKVMVVAISFAWVEAKVEIRKQGKMRWLTRRSAPANEVQAQAP